MHDLIKPMSKGTILQRSAIKCKDIGVILLNDDSGAIVEAITKSASSDQFEAARMIYTRWMEEHEDHSWRKLIQCFRDVQLKALASDIEQHLGLSLPSVHGIVAEIQTSLYYS